MDTFLPFFTLLRRPHSHTHIHAHTHTHTHTHKHKHTLTHTHTQIHTHNTHTHTHTHTHSHSHTHTHTLTHTLSLSLFLSALPSQRMDSTTSATSWDVEWLPRHRTMHWIKRNGPRSGRPCWGNLRLICFLPVRHETAAAVEAQSGMKQQRPWRHSQS